MLDQFEHLVSSSVEEAQRSLLYRYVEKLVTLLQDPINKVYNYTCTALSILIGTARERIIPFAGA